MPTSNQWEEKLGIDEASKEAQRQALLEGMEGVEGDKEQYIDEASYYREQAMNLAQNDLNFLAALAMPLVFTLLFPPIFLHIWQLLVEYVHKTRDFSKLAIGLPRGFGKTTFIKVFCLYCILFTKKKFILIVCETLPKAEGIIADVIDMLNEPNIIKVFGDWKLGIEKDTQPLKKFSFRGRNIILYASGGEGAVRGINLKFDRPDVILFEDVQSRECADSAVQSASLEKWMVGTAMKAKSPAGCLYIFVANMYPTKYSILKKLKENKVWKKFIVGGILHDGQSLWEELQPIDQLLEELDHDIAMGHPEIFFAEVLNDETAGLHNNVDISKFSDWPYLPDDIPQGKYIIIDPSTDKDASDLVSIGCFGVFDGKPALIEVDEDRYSPSDTIRRALLMALRQQCAVVCVEATAYQYSLLHWFAIIIAQVGITGIELCELYNTQRSKNARIKDTLKDIQAGEILLHPSVRSKVIHQATEWKPLKRDNTDGLLDLLAYCVKALELYGHLMTHEGVIINAEYENLKVTEHNSPF